MCLRFTWDEEKNQQNIRKHGVSFEESATIFTGFPLKIFFDPDHSQDEQRYLAFGFSEKNRALLVVHCENQPGDEIRIISSRRATRAEQRDIFGGDT